VENLNHDILELSVHFLKSPAHSLAVLTHLQGGSGYAARIGRFAGNEVDTLLQEVFGGFDRGGHIRAFRDGDDAVLHQRHGVFDRQFILRRAGKGDIHLDIPHATAFVIHSVRFGCHVLGQPGLLHFLDFLQEVQIDTVFVVNPTRRIRAGHNLGAHLLRLFDRINRYVARAGDRDGFAAHGNAVIGEHFFHNIEQSVSGGFLSDQGTAEGKAFPGQYAFV